MAPKALISAELEAALAANDGVSVDPADELREASTWRTSAERMCGHLSTHVEFILALSVHPGANAPSEDLSIAYADLLDRFGAMREKCFGVVGLDPRVEEAQRHVAFKLSRLIAQWVCRQWRFEKAGIGDAFSPEQVIEFLQFSTPAIPAFRDAQAPSLRVALMESFSRLADVVNRFDFFHTDRGNLLRRMWEVVRVRAAAYYTRLKSQSEELQGEEGDRVLIGVLGVATDLYANAYLAEARSYTRRFLSVSDEEASHMKHVAKLANGLDLAPVDRAFWRLFDLMVEVTESAEVNGARPGGEG